ncbi:MAG: phosphopantothenoylcysteine decarboxylase [Planctomycetales bacterium]|nr:phosphopantothenoylcysteine decarboxylase [Planctomycetales bacterium]
MSRILITSGPTRQYLDPVRFLTNASSGRMGQALATAALAAGHEVTVISGPVEIQYPAEARVIDVISTEEMLSAAQAEFPTHDGLIGVAAPCDYRPRQVSDQKLHKTGHGLVLELIETPDVVATLGAGKRSDQWAIAFALETEDHRFRALRKLEQKCCDLVVLNSPSAMNALDTQIEMLNKAGRVVLSASGSKTVVAQKILEAAMLEVNFEF